MLGRHGDENTSNNYNEATDERACISTGHGAFLQSDRPVGSSLYLRSLGSIGGKFAQAVVLSSSLCDIHLKQAHQFR
jgi:hypothetical protein